MKSKYLSQFNSSQLILYLFLIIFIYFSFAAISNIRVNHTSLFIPTKYAYYNNLIDSILKGRLNLVGQQSNHDLSFFNNKWYMYWGPAPVLFILPFYVIVGSHVSDTLYGVAAGILNIVLFFLALQQLIKLFNIKISPGRFIFIVFNFSFISPNLFVASLSGVWGINQIIAIFYLLLFYFFFLKYLNNNNRLLYFVLAVLFFNLSWFSRYTLLFNVVFLFYAIFAAHLKEYKEKLNLIFIFTVITSCFIGIFFSYNYLRFHNIFETGHRYQVGNPLEFSEKINKMEVQRYTTLQQTGKAFSFEYIKRNIWYYFGNPIQILQKWPFLKFDWEGNSIFLVYPLTLIIPLLFSRKHFDLKEQRSSFLIVSFFYIFLTIAVLLSFVMTGWIQFGNRYFLDVVPILFLLSAFVINKIPRPILYFILIYGAIINLVGISIHYEVL